MIKVPVSYGELIDKWTILSIKFDKITDQTKLGHVEKELSELDHIISRDIGPGIKKILEEIRGLKKVNRELWDIEDQLRVMEAEKIRDVASIYLEEIDYPDPDEGDDFKAKSIIKFIDLARSVYITNDKRAAFKRSINEKLGSDLVEVKDYVEYE